MISLLIIVVALLGTNLYALISGSAIFRLPFALAAIALCIALLGPFAGILHIPLPSQFLLLWLLIIPLAVISAIAATLVGLLGQAQGAFTSLSTRTSHTHRYPRMRIAVVLLLTSMVLIIAVATLLPPMRLLTAPVQGIETSPGVVSGDTRYSASFVASVTGPIAGVLNITVNYQPAYPRPGISHKIISGSWSLAVYKAGSYQGTIYGPFANGIARWNLDVTEATLDVTLPIAGGTGLYLGERGSAHLTGYLLHLTYPPSIAGNVTLHLR